MLKYLLNFDVSNTKEIEVIEELDITDKTVLEGQINCSRKSYKELLELLDSLTNDKVVIQQKLARKKQEVYSSTTNRNERSDIMNTDDDIIEYQSTLDALSDAMSTVKNYIDFVKTDLRILGNSQYSKF